MQSALVIGTSSDFRRTVLEQLGNTGLFGDIYCASELQGLEETLRVYCPQAIFYIAESNDAVKLNLFQYIQKLEAFRDIPLLAFIPSDNPEDRVSILEKGAIDCLSLAMSNNEMTARIRNHLRLRTRLDHLRQTKKDLVRLALTDSLTGLYNRAFFDVTLDAEMSRSSRSGAPLSLMMIDVDNFKRINDFYGHQFGDQVLCRIAKSIENLTRESDTAGRFGGEEFVALLPGMDAPQAYAMASRIRQHISRELWDTRFHEPLATVSIGISCLTKSDPLTAQELLAYADHALYAAKNKGRNRTEIFSLAKFDPAPLSHFGPERATYA